MEYKIKSIELINIRNIKNGKIDFCNDETKINTVTGIYGQNASGKSSLIKAIDFIRKMVDYRYDFNKSELLINFDSNDAAIKIEIVVDDTVIKYQIFITRNQGKVCFDGEQLHVNDECVFHVDHAKKDILVNKLISAQHESELMVMTEIAYEVEKSCFGSKYAFEKLFKTDLCTYPEAIEAIYKLSTRVNIISDHDSSSNNIDDNLVIFDLNKDGIDDLTIDLDNKGLVRKEVYERLKPQFASLNAVISAIVPTLSLAVEIEQRSEEFLRLGYYTKRKGVDKLIPLSEESYGIKKIISLAFSLMQVMNRRDFILIVDELDAGIFEYLLGQLIEVVDNYSAGQLIFTSHNLRAVEVLDADSVVFTTSNINNCFVKIPKHEYLDNMRDTYYRSIILGGTTEELYNKTIDNDILMGLMSYE